MTEVRMARICARTNKRFKRKQPKDYWVVLGSQNQNRRIISKCSENICSSLMSLIYWWSFVLSCFFGRCPISPEFWGKQFIGYFGVLDLRARQLWMPMWFNNTLQGTEKASQARVFLMFCFSVVIYPVVLMAIGEREKYHPIIFEVQHFVSYPRALHRWK